MSASDSVLQRMDELLIDEILWGLDGDERAEFEALTASTPIDSKQRLSYEIAAAQACVSLYSESSTETGSKLWEAPAPMRERLESLAVHTLMQRRNLSLTDLDSKLDSAAEPAAVTSGAFPGPRPWLSQLVAAAAVVLASFLLYERSRTAEDLDRLVNDVLAARDAQKLPWQDRNLQGQVTWSSDMQRGVLTIEGLEKNNPDEFRYQLWIVDESRDGANRVDGGLFDVAGDGTVQVPFTPRLDVRNAAMFAVTVEKPWGAVVSQQRSFVALAKF